MFGFIKNWFKPKKSFEEIKAERSALREKIELLEKTELAYEICKELGKINLKDTDADEQIVYCLDKLYQSGVTKAMEAAYYYWNSQVLTRDEKLADRIMELWQQTKAYKLEMMKTKINKLQEDFND